MIRFSSNPDTKPFDPKFKPVFNSALFEVSFDSVSFNLPSRFTSKNFSVESWVEHLILEKTSILFGKIPGLSLDTHGFRGKRMLRIQRDQISDPRRALEDLWSRIPQQILIKPCNKACAQNPFTYRHKIYTYIHSNMQKSIPNMRFFNVATTLTLCISFSFQPNSLIYGAEENTKNI